MTVEVQGPVQPQGGQVHTHQGEQVAGTLERRGQAETGRVGREWGARGGAGVALLTGVTPWRV